MTPTSAGLEAGAVGDPMFCETCHRIERDPIMLDTETCSQCGGYLAALDDDDGQPDEAQEWSDYDPDC